MSTTPRKATAQVAVEAIANVFGDGYDVQTIEAVRTEAREAGVSDFYIDMLPPPVVICFAHRDEWGSDEDCAHCTDPDGFARPVPPQV